MKIKKHIVGPIQTNCYLVWDQDTMDAMLIDPGGGKTKLLGTIKSKGVTLKAIVHTHGHWDHTWASKAVQKSTGATVLRHPADVNRGLLSRERPSNKTRIRDLDNGSGTELGRMVFKVLHVPGHSPGSIALYTQGVLFAGDLLFKGAVGRWDLSGGSFRELVNSLNHRLAEIPDDTRVLPGHGPETNLGVERRTNPFFKSARS